MNEAIVLAGGSGTRLRPAVSDRPKVLADISGRPFLAYLFDLLLDQGVKRVILATGYLGEQIEDHFGSSYRRAVQSGSEYHRSIELVYSREKSPLGTGGALSLALSYCKDERVLVLNGDSYCDFDLEALYRFHRLKSAIITIVAVLVEDRSRFGTIVCDGDRRILAFDEKNPLSGSGLINAGIYLCERRSVEDIPFGQASSFEQDQLPARLDQGCYAFTTAGPFIDIGTPRTYTEATRFFDRLTDRSGG